MRESYRDQLDGVIGDLVAMSETVQATVGEATQALLEADLGIAERVITDDQELDAIHNDVEHRCFSLLARQAPVAGELRIVVAALRMVAELARMGDLAAHVAKIARLRFPEKAVPLELAPNFARMATVSGTMIRTAGETLASRDTTAAEKLIQSDEEIDELRRDQFSLLLGNDWEHGVEAAVDVALLGRYYERIADHAVSMGRRVTYIVTGQAPDENSWP